VGRRKAARAPTIRGIRLTPDTLIEHFEAGVTAEEIHELFPSVTTQDVLTILDYAVRNG
jgi:uncharacterized protein (DUF433 family)